MTRPPTLLEQLAVGAAAAVVTRAVLERLDRRRRDRAGDEALQRHIERCEPAAGCSDCLEVDLARSTPGQPPLICGQTLMAPPVGGCR